MDSQNPIPKSRIVIIAMLLWAVGLSCSMLSGISTSTPPTGQNSPLTPAPAGSPAPSKAVLSNQPTLPTGWKLSKDTSGACQVSAPPDWQLGRDFFLEAEKPDPGPFVNAPGQFPPRGLALWGADKLTDLPEGKQFQIRKSLMTGDRVCSVWRIKASTNFTEAEKSQMEQVGKTLQEAGS